MIGFWPGHALDGKGWGEGSAANGAMAAQRPQMTRGEIGDAFLICLIDDKEDEMFHLMHHYNVDTTTRLGFASSVPKMLRNGLNLHMLTAFTNAVRCFDTLTTTWDCDMYDLLGRHMGHFVAASGNMHMADIMDQIGGVDW